MKKLFRFFMAALLIGIMAAFICAPSTYAADSSPTDVISSYLSWNFLGTMAGAIAATLLIVQFLKVPLDYMWKIPTRFFVYFIALLILLAAEYVLTGILDFDKIGLIVLNAFIVSTAAMGTYEATIKKLEKPG